jgi:hypothetical protein
MGALSVEDLFAGAEITHAIAIPSALLGEGVAGEIELRPLAIRDVDRIVRAAKEQRVLTSILMVQQALVSPKLSVDQVGKLPAGLVQFLVAKVNELSGLSLDESDLDRAVKAPLARACFVLSREFGWTPAECAELTVGQVLLYLEMIARGETEAT